LGKLISPPAELAGTAQPDPPIAPIEKREAALLQYKTIPSLDGQSAACLTDGPTIESTTPFVGSLATGENYDLNSPSTSSTSRNQSTATQDLIIRVRGDDQRPYQHRQSVTAGVYRQALQ